MSELRKEQEEKILSILFNVGGIPKSIKSIILDIFLEKRHQNIMSAISKIHEGGKFNYKNIAFYMADKTENKKWLAELDRIKELNIPEDELDEIVNTLKEGVVKEKIKKINSEIEDKVLNGGDLSYIENIKKDMNNLNLMQSNENIQNLDEVLEKTMAKIQEGLDKESAITGVSTGIKSIDNNTGGFNATDLTVIAARPGQGKTSFVINVINSFLTQENPTKSLFFSAEMPSFQLGMRLLAMQAQVDAQKMRTPKKITKEEMSRILEKRELIKRAPIYTNDTAAISIQEIAEIAKRKRDEEGIEIIFVDYLQRLKYAGFGVEKMSKAERVGEIAKGLKELAKELEVPVIALAQLNRSVDKGGIPPTLSDLKDSGDIEQEADVIGFVHRDNETIEDINQPHMVNYIIAKNRHGPLGFLDLNWIPCYTQFLDIQEKKTESPF